MVVLVDAQWVADHLERPDTLVLDPRTRMRYLAGHLKGAINLPRSQLFDAQGGLLPVEDLARALGNAGLGDGVTPVVYDGFDGQSGAMLAWLLEYVGRNDVRLMEVFWERWVQEGGAVFYRQVKSQPRRFVAQLNPAVRASAEDLLSNPDLKRVDVRSREEYTGERDTDGTPGHIPGAVNMVWQDLLARDRASFAAKDELEGLLAAARVRKGERVVTYCRTGPRAAVGYLALRRLGYDVRLYDGSYADWVRRGLPVER